MPIATLHTTHHHIVQVWELLDGDVAHPDGYADVTIDGHTNHATLPIDVLTEV